jgi:uncharacterized protein DUF3592
MFLAIGWSLTKDRVTFSMHSERARGEVVHIYPRNGRCRSSKLSYDCTKFTAGIRVNSKNKGPLEVLVDADSARRHDQPPSFARYKVGELIPVVFDPDHPERAYLDTIFEVWGMLVAIVVLLCASIYGLIRGRFLLDSRG